MPSSSQVLPDWTRTRPAAPTIVQANEVGHETAFRAVGCIPAAGRAVHEAPPFAVIRIVEASPTATQSNVDEQLTPRRLFAVPDGWGAQVAPSFALTRIEPPYPTATQTEIDGQLTAERKL